MRITTALICGIAVVLVGAPDARSLRAQALSVVPDNPCDVFTREQMSAVTGLDVAAVVRLTGAHVVGTVQQQREDEPTGTCVYETRSPFGEIAITVPPVAQRTSEQYWADRSRYFGTYGPSAQGIPGVGLDAWIGGSASLHVLVRENEYFMASTQNPMVGEGRGREHFLQSREILTKIARALAVRF